MNKLMLIGRLAEKPTLVYTPNGKAVCSISMAVQRTYKNANGEKETDFFRLAFWGNRANNLYNYADKGALLSIVGELRNRSYEHNGQRRYVTEVLVNEFQLLESRAQRVARQNGLNRPELPDMVLDTDETPEVATATTEAKDNFEITDDMLPF